MHCAGFVISQCAGGSAPDASSRRPKYHAATCCVRGGKAICRIVSQFLEYRSTLVLECTRTNYSSARNNKKAYTIDFTGSPRSPVAGPYMYMMLACALWSLALPESSSDSCTPSLPRRSPTPMSRRHRSKPVSTRGCIAHHIHALHDCAYWKLDEGSERLIARVAHED